MESYEVLRQALENASPKEIAAEIGVSLSLVYKWAQSTDIGSGTVNPLDRVMQIYRVSKDDNVIQWLCHHAGGFFVKNPRMEKGNFDLMPATQSIVQQFAEMLTAISKAAADHTISEKEAKEIRREWDELKRFTEGFVRCCENGDFDKMEQLSREMKPKKES
jgi:transcriptional regulator with XRE-family HTH domain